MHACSNHLYYSSHLVQEDTHSNLGREPVDHNQVTGGDLELATTFRQDTGVWEEGECMNTLKAAS